MAMRRRGNYGSGLRMLLSRTEAHVRSRTAGRCGWSIICRNADVEEHACLHTRARRHAFMRACIINPPILPSLNWDGRVATPTLLLAGGAYRAASGPWPIAGAPTLHVHTALGATSPNEGGSKLRSIGRPVRRCKPGASAGSAARSSSRLRPKQGCSWRAAPLAARHA